MIYFIRFKKFFLLRCLTDYVRLTYRKTGLYSAEVMYDVNYLNKKNTKKNTVLTRAVQISILSFNLE